jgi:hypothetical protein
MLQLKFYWYAQREYGDVVPSYLRKNTFDTINYFVYLYV